MIRLFVAGLAVFGMLPMLASAVDLKNVQFRFGPLGAARTVKKVLPGDSIFMTYEIGGLVVDPKSGKAEYETKVELLDAQGKVISKSETLNEPLLYLGGGRMPGDLNIVMGPRQVPGRYSLRVTVKDKLGKDLKAFSEDFELLPASFGIINTFAPAIGLPGQQQAIYFNLVNLGLDAAKKPDVSVTIRLRDESGKPIGKATEILLPRDLPAGVNLNRFNWVPLSYSIYCHRAGRFTVEIEADDKISKKKVELRSTFMIPDLGKLTGK